MQDVTGLVKKLLDHAADAFPSVRREAAAALTAQAERIAELERDIKHAITMEQFAIDRANKLERDLAAAREDAERYRFWRMRVHFAMSMGRRELAFCLTKDYGPAQHEEHGRQVDAAIDAARSK